jgi:hypothetical protein
MHSFDENDGEYDSADNSAEDVLEEIAEQEAQQEAEEDAVDTVLSNAIERIEEANVWKLLISQDVIAPGSASNRVVKSVNSQLKKFGLNRLEILLGMKEERIEKAAIQLKPQFDPDEEKALRILAAKVLGRSISSAISTPELAPKLNTMPVPEARKEPQLMQVKAPVVQRPAPVKGGASPPPKMPNPKRVVSKAARRTKVPEGALVDKGFAMPGREAKMRSMPTPDQQMAMYGASPAPQMNISVDQTARQGDVSRGNNLLGQIVGQLTGGHMLAVDNSVPQDAGDDANERF